MKTFIPSAKNIERKWYVIDAAGLPMGRVASQVATILRGKNKPEFTPFIDMGDNVIVVNAAKIVFTGKKLDQKVYVTHTGQPGGNRETTARQMMDKNPERAFRLAVKGMLPKNAIGKQMISKLWVYAGPEHEQAAQKPEKLEIKA
ncbi:MAG: 50S ribosomal protein L13 [Firmicutes bacterium]|jgi:large subunit ribosomal protein L13|nr:50S ribosomal protein L13 [Clostridia bacterium]MBQ5959888.1 50S ribosomal protein L13 [Bacillota bacterium]